MRFSFTRPVLFFILLTGISGPHSAAGSDTTELTVWLTGGWNGQHRLNETGARGLAVLSSLLQQNTEDSVQKGHIRIYFGAFSGAAMKDSLIKYKEAVKDDHYPDSLNLMNYLQFDAIALNSTEMTAVEAIPELRGNPYLSYNRRQAVVSKEDISEIPAREIAPFRIVSRAGLSVYLSAMTEAPEPSYDSTPGNRFLKELNRNRGANLFVVAVAPSGHSHKDERYFSETTFQKDLAKDRLGENPFHPHEDHILNRLLVAKQGENRFYRLQTGPYVCETKPAQVCAVTFRFRRGRILGARARFIELDESQRTWRYIEPDPVVIQALNISKP